MLAIMENGVEHRFAVCRNDEIIACTGLMQAEANKFELGYWVGKDYRGAGVAKKIAAAIVFFGFEKLGAETIAAGHFANNPASGTVLRYVGFRATGETIATFSKSRGGDVETLRFVIDRAALRLHDKIAIHPI